MFAYHSSILGLGKPVVTAVPGPVLGKLDQHSVQHVGYLFVDVFRAVIRMKSAYTKGELVEHCLQNRTTDTSPISSSPRPLFPTG